jgi:hypothetical protein
MTEMMWYAAGIGFAFGWIFGEWFYKRIVLLKVKDGTAEKIGGKWYYFMTAQDWRLLEAWRLPTLRPGESEQVVLCPECGNEQVDCGANVKCLFCHHAPMPYHINGELIEP